MYYATSTPTLHNRVRRFTANGNVDDSNSELILLDLEPLGATNHNGGALHFAADDTLYVGVGDNANSANAQALSNRLGKILRINPDGSMPISNPFYNSTTGANRAIWAFGLRNPFTFAFQSGTGQILINDVGERTWEEINDGIAGANYGWPATEGATTISAYRSPFYAYVHDGSTCALTGGTFYNPSLSQFPPTYVGRYFFANYCAGWIKSVDPDDNTTVTNFATGISFPVDFQVGPDGALYYLARGNTSVFRILYTVSQIQPPTITTQPSNQQVSVGQTATFSVAANGVRLPLSL